jgi:hypothetical protein
MVAPLLFERPNNNNKKDWIKEKAEDWNSACSKNN